MKDKIKIQPAQWPDHKLLIERIEAALSENVAALPQNNVAGREIQYAVPPNAIKGMADIATNAWRARGKMLDPGSGEVREEMKRVYRHIDSILETLRGLGLEIKDHTGEPFDYGLPLKVVTTQPSQGITKESVVETIKPTVYWQKQIIQMGEVVIATPISPTTKI